jgi:hypothetical protein
MLAARGLLAALPLAACHDLEEIRFARLAPR